MTEKQKQLWMTPQEVAAELNVLAKYIWAPAAKGKWRRRKNPTGAAGFVYRREDVMKYKANRDQTAHATMVARRGKPTGRKTGKRPPIVELDLASEVTPQVVYREPTHTMVMVPFKKLTAVMAVLEHA